MDLSVRELVLVFISELITVLFKISILLALEVLALHKVGQLLHLILTSLALRQA